MIDNPIFINIFKLIVFLREEEIKIYFPQTEFRQGIRMYNSFKIKKV